MTTNASVADDFAEPDNLPALPEPQTVDVQAPLGLPTAGEWGALQSMAEVLSRSGLVPAGLRRKPDDIMLILLTGRDLRLQPTVALNKIHVIEGKPTCSAELMAALVNRQPGMSLWPGDDNDAEKATAYGSRDGREFHFTFSLKDAQRAGLAGKGTWAKWPQFMLWARAVSGLCRMAFSDVLVGVAYTPEELGAEVNPETGEVLDVQHREVAPPDASPLISGDNVARITAQAEVDGLTIEDLRQVILTATEGRTDAVAEVYKTDIPRLRDAMKARLDRTAPDDQPADPDPGRPFEEA